MKQPIPIYIAVEDELSEWVVRRTLSARRPVCYGIGAVYTRGGYGHLKKQAPAFNHAAKGCPFLLLTDLDRHACPSALVADWLGQPKHPHFLLRVAVREVESWLLADAKGIGKLLRLKSPPVFPDPEKLTDPKLELLNLALRCPTRQTREALVWRDEKNGRLFQGPDYNGVLAPFVQKQWDIRVAQRSCRSLDRLLLALERLEKDFRRRLT